MVFFIRRLEESGWNLRPCISNQFHPVTIGVLFVGHRISILVRSIRFLSKWSLLCGRESCLKFTEKFRHDLYSRFVMLIGKTYFIQCNWFCVVSSLFDAVLNSTRPAGIQCVAQVIYISDNLNCWFVISNDLTQKCSTTVSLQGWP